MYLWFVHCTSNYVQLHVENFNYTTFALSWTSSTYLDVEFQECSTHARQDAMVMCLNTEMLTNNIKRHMVVHLNVSAVKKCTLAYQELFRRGKRVRAENKTVISNIYIYFKE